MKLQVGKLVKLIDEFSYVIFASILFVCSETVFILTNFKSDFFFFVVAHIELDIKPTIKS